MTDNSELQRLTRLRRLARQIAASLPAAMKHTKKSGSAEATKASTQ